MYQQKKRFLLGFAKLQINSQTCQVHSQTQTESSNYIANRCTLPFSQMPGPSVLSLVLWNRPGGPLYNKDIQELFKFCREKYGDIFKMPSLFGIPNIVVSHDPSHFEKIFRTEGQQPDRPGLDVIQYYREKVRPDVYMKYKGLLNSQGCEWAEIRKLVNPLMAHPKNAKIYLPMIDQVADDFLERIRYLRHPSTKQLPGDFETELNRWALETLGVLGLDVRLGLLTDTLTARSIEFMNALKAAFELAYELSMKPPVWKLFPTSEFKNFVNAMDTITEIIIEYIVLAKKKANSNVDCESQSILQKLMRIDEKVAVGMAMSIIFSGIDTVSTALVSVLYPLAKNPEKQEILRKEIRVALPEKNSSFTSENMSNLPYLRACIKEGLRIIPTVPRLARRAGQSLILNGYEIPQGTRIGLTWPQGEKYFERASEFIPERWLKQNYSIDACPVSTKLSHPFTYLPFGFGPRMCIGRRFAEMEIEVMISKIVKHFNVSWEQPDLTFKQRFVNIPAGKLMFTLRDVAQ